MLLKIIHLFICKNIFKIKGLWDIYIKHVLLNTFVLNTKQFSSLVETHKENYNILKDDDKTEINKCYQSNSLMKERNHIIHKNKVHYFI